MAAQVNCAWIVVYAKGSFRKQERSPERHAVEPVMIHGEGAYEGGEVAVRKITQVRLGVLPLEILVHMHAVVVQNGEPRDQQQRKREQRPPMRSENPRSLRAHPFAPGGGRIGELDRKLPRRSH